MTKIRRENYPIEFFIENQYQKSPALYILENPEKQKEQTEVHFIIKNISENQTFVLKPMTDLSKDHHQFALIFSSGILKYEHPADIPDAFSVDNINDGKWWVTPLNTNDIPGDEVLYFGHTNKGTLTVGPGESFTIKARGLAAEPKGGSRTTQVQLHYKFPEEGSTNTTVEGRCHHHLDIYNYLGTSYAPFVAGMLGLDELLSTHSGAGAARSQLSVKNDFSIFLTSSDPGEQLDFADNTQIELRFPYYAGSTYDEGVSTPTFVLGSQNEVAGIKTTNKTIRDKIADIKREGEEEGLEEAEILKLIEAESPPPLKEGDDVKTDMLTYEVAKVIDMPSKDGKWGYRVIRFALKEAVQLPFLRIDFMDLVVSGGNENSRIFLAVRNIPGYRDTEMALNINKTNMVMKGYKTGIRTNDPQQELHVEGNALVDGQLLIGKPEKLAAAKEAFDKEYQNKDQNDSAIIFAPHQNYSDHAWIRFHSRSGAAHNLEVQVKQSEHGTDYLALQPQGGKVGIGTQEPTEALEVKGRVKDQTGYLMPVGSIIAYGGQTIPDGWLECNGQVIQGGDEYRALKDALGEGHNAKTPDLRSRFIVGLENGKDKDLNKDPLQGDANFKVLHKSEGFPSIKKTDLLGLHTHRLKGIFYSIKATLSGGSGSVKVLKEESSTTSQGRTGSAGDADGNAIAPKIIPPFYVLRYIIKY